MSLPKHASARLILADPFDRVLLFQHQRDETSAAHWITPGGGLEPGETPAAGVIRELREETGFELNDVGEPVAFAAGRWRSPLGTLFDQVTWYFFARGAGGELDLSGESSAWHIDPFTLALRHNVSAGDEITVDYATQTTDSTFRFTCHCAAKSCRGTVSGDDWRDLGWRQRFRGHVVPAVAALIA